MAAFTLALQTLALQTLAVQTQVLRDSMKLRLARSRSYNPK